jgi:hypothetical protein
MNINTLLYLTLHDPDRAWKSFDWNALNRLDEQGMIGDLVNKAESVVHRQGTAQIRAPLQATLHAWRRGP